MEMDEGIYQKATTGKVRRQRKKLHAPAKNQHVAENETPQLTDSTPTLPITPPKDDLFAGLDIDFDSLNKSLVPDDVQSVKSYKSLKSESGKHALSKKEKIKLRRELLLQRIDTVNQLKKELKLREKRKKTAIIGDTNPLHDALPSLESLLKGRSNVKQTETKNIKKKGIEKAKQRKKKLVEGVKMFKQALNNKDFKKNPLEVISSHVKAVVQQERQQKQ